MNAAAETSARRGPGAWARLWGNRVTRLCIIAIGLYTLLALYGEGVYRYYKGSLWEGAPACLTWAPERVPPYNQVHMESRYLPPLSVSTWPAHTLADGTAVPETTHRYWLGSDNLGRDVLQRLIQGARIAFHVGIMTSLIAIPLSAMPGLLFILAIALIAGKGLFGIYLGIGLTTWVSVCRNIRAEVIKHRDRAYVQAARVLGYSHGRILFRHILPNVMHIVLISFSIRFPASVATEVFISFLGIGVQGEPSWGIMINNARARLWQGIWWELTFVSLAIFLLVLIFNRLADDLRDVFDPALRNR